MKTATLLSISRYIGVGLAMCVPAMVVAQVLPSFSDNQVLRGAELRALRDAVARLQASTIQKSQIRQVTRVVPIPVRATPAVTAECEENEIMLHCGCRGLADAAEPDHLLGQNSTSQDLRMVLLRNPTTKPQCICQAQNSGSNENAGLVAIATCAPVG